LGGAENTAPAAGSSAPVFFSLYLLLRLVFIIARMRRCGCGCCVGVGVVGVGVVGVSEGERERTYNFVCPQVLLYVSSSTAICVSSGSTMTVRLPTHAWRTYEGTHAGVM
jgi:hypothetical protein